MSDMSTPESTTEAAPQSPFQAIPDDKNLLKQESDAGSCCGGACHTS